jgi:hypothetical protein
MKDFLLIILFLIVVQSASATSPPKLRAQIVTWDKSRVTGLLDAITDSTISVRIYNGEIHTFSAKQTKNLKIWKPWIKLPAAIAGATALTVILVDKSSNRTCLPDLGGFFVGIVGGSIAGYIAGDLICTKFSKRRMHISDFKIVSSKL